MVARPEEQREREDEVMQESGMAGRREGKKGKVKHRSVKEGCILTENLKNERQGVHFHFLLFFRTHPYLEGFHVVGNYKLFHKCVGVMVHTRAPVQAGTEISLSRRRETGQEEKKR